ncbi:MAG: CueP family metal-binding protein [Propionibacteriaceae bacterium]|nr:CueP family metal-binding protein [Propionibacteriaceae bacterium]
MSPSRMILALTTAAVLGLAGCAGASESPAPSAGSTTSATTTAATGAEATGPVQARPGLPGQSAEQVVDTLDRTNDDRTAGPVGSVRPGEVILADDQGQVSLPLSDKFYLSFAPYVTRTHDCFNHNLATCQGELANQQMDVTITTDAGETLVDEALTSFDNGFIGVWLPKDIKGTIKVSHDGKSVSAPIATGPKDPTCVTTLKLS